MPTSTPASLCGLYPTSIVRQGTYTYNGSSLGQNIRKTPAFTGVLTGSVVPKGKATPFYRIVPGGASNWLSLDEACNQWTWQYAPPLGVTGYTGEATATPVPPTPTRTLVPMPTSTSVLEATPTPIINTPGAPTTTPAVTVEAPYPRYSKTDGTVTFRATKTVNIRTALATTGTWVGTMYAGTGGIIVFYWYEVTDGGVVWGCIEAVTHYNLCRRWVATVFDFSGDGIVDALNPADVSLEPWPKLDG